MRYVSLSLLRGRILIDRMAHYDAPGLSIAVINDGILAWAKGYGKLTNSPDSKLVDTNTLFQAGSISKSLNAIGALLLAQQEKISLDEDVNQYLKSWKIPEHKFKKDNKVTLRRLLSHNAGISVHGFPGYTIDQKVPSLVEILDGKKPLVNTDPIRVITQPGKESRYSGGGTTIVQLLIEDLTGEKYDVWMQKNVLTPLGMHASTFNQPLSTKHSQIAAYGHINAGKKVKGNWHIYPEMAAAGLWTTPTDLAHFILSIQHILKGHAGLLPIDLVKEMIKPQIEKTGLGVFLNNEGKDFEFSHGGVDEGFIAKYNAYPFRGQGMIIMVNSTNAFGLINEINNSIADIYQIPGFEPITKKIIYVDPASYKKFVGVYKYDHNEEEIGFINEKLFVLNKNNPKLNHELWPVKENTFFDKDNMVTLEFKYSSKKIDAFEVIYQNGTKTIFKKIEMNSN